MRLRHDHADGYRRDCTVCTAELEQVVQGFTELGEAIEAALATGGIVGGPPLAIPSGCDVRERLGLSTWDVEREAWEDRP
jgi:hypothetical protein